jgi:hypothetical protein
LKCEEAEVIILVTKLNRCIEGAYEVHISLLKDWDEFARSSAGIVAVVVVSEYNFLSLRVG